MLNCIHKISVYHVYVSCIKKFSIFGIVYVSIYTRYTMFSCIVFQTLVSMLVCRQRYALVSGPASSVLCLLGRVEDWKSSAHSSHAWARLNYCKVSFISPKS